MRYQQIVTAILLAMSFSISSCEIIGGIFKAGVWSGILIVVLVIALLAFIAGKLLKKGE